MISDRDQVKELLRERIEDLCARLLPDGRRQGRLWVSYNPVTNDYNRSSPELKVALTGDVGAWKDWRSGDKGDVIGLISYVNRSDFAQAMRWARDFLGIANLSAEERRRIEEQSRIKAKARAERADQARLWKIREAEKKFLSGLALGAGSAAERHVRAYLAGRLAGLEVVQNLDVTSFRAHAGAEYWTLAEYRADEAGRRMKVKDGPRFPALMSAMRSPTGQTIACHATFLDPVEPKKIALGQKHPAKLIFGEAKGAVIRIAHGPEGEPPETALIAHPLVLCEGIETGLSLAAAIPEARVWAAGSLSNMANAPVSLDCVSAIIVARDNNFGNDQAQRQLEAALAALKAAGKPLEVMASPIGDDFNDLARGEDA